ncbi:hypothetical protein ZWY2020_025863 [Hordeum vulgare]|nr:hypothetical protein ZWY2020_025863 [Hordeum vulgare]
MTPPLVPAQIPETSNLGLLQRPPPLPGWKSSDLKMLDYVVCNPATKKWVTVPATKLSWNMSSAFLGFDPAVSSHFYVFELVAAIAWNPSKRMILALKWWNLLFKVGSGHPVAWDDPFGILYLSGDGAFLSGVLYLCYDNNSVAAVDLEKL